MNGETGHNKKHSGSRQSKSIELEHSPSNFEHTLFICTAPVPIGRQGMNKWATTAVRHQILRSYRLQSAKPRSEFFFFTYTADQVAFSGIMDPDTRLGPYKGPVLVGLTGRAGHGKDETWTMLGQIPKAERTQRLSFAEPIKRACSEIWGVPLPDFSEPGTKDTKHPLWNMSPRDMAIFLGTEVMRDTVDENFWVTRLENVFRQHDDSNTIFVVTDVRFDNEAEMIKRNGGVVARVDASERLGGADEEGSVHKTEAGIKPELVDYVINNNGSIDDLENEVHSFWRFLCWDHQDGEDK